jgi:hypothetical protein
LSAAGAVDFESLIVRVRSEFMEMPALCLSVPQAMRLLGLQQVECQRVFDALVNMSFLRRTSRGEFTRV